LNKHYSYNQYSKKITSEDIIERFIPKIKAIAISLKTTLPENVEVDDLVQEGLIGLLNVQERYDPGRGATFFTFAMKRIRGAMYDYLRKIDWIPRNTRHLMKQVEKALMELEGRDGELPDEKKVAGYLDIPLRDVQLALKEMSRRQLLNLDGFLTEDSEDFTEIFPGKSKTPEEVYNKAELNEQLQIEIEGLKERERNLLSLYYVEDLNFKEIAEVFGVTESRISQIHRSIMVKLKKRMQIFLGNEEVE